MNTGSLNLNQCSSCRNTLSKYDLKLLICLHSICKRCIVLQQTNSGIECTICELVTANGELIELPNIPTEICWNTDCRQEAFVECTICLVPFCKSCCMDHKQFDDAHRQHTKTVFELLQSNFELLQSKIIQCPNCTKKPAEVFCSQCSTIHCALCHIVNHIGHDYTRLDNRCSIVSANENLMLNSKYINECIAITESHISEIETNYNTAKSEIDKQWEKIHEEIMDRKMQINCVLEELYLERVSEINKNKSTLQKLNSINEYYLSFTSSILRHNRSYDDVKLVKTIVDNQAKISISEDTPELLLTIMPNFSIKNVIRSLENIISVIKPVTKISSSSILDLSRIIGVKMPTKNIETEYLQTHIVEKLYIHDVYKKSYSQETVLKTHRFHLTNRKTYNCDVCKKSYLQKQNLKSHILNHTDENPYKCDTCKKSYSRKAYLNQHMIIHTGLKPYKCNICKKSFLRKAYLSQHMIIHTGEKPYKCNTCKKSFSHKYYLNQHMINHTGLKPYKCDTCKKSFLKKGYLSQHMIIHTGLKPYKCNICKKSFSTKAYLSNHVMIIHNGERPYKCTICERPFSFKCNLNTHMKRYHS